MIGLLASPSSERRVIARGLASALAAVLAFGASARAEPIQGAGSTFAAPIIEQWSRSYRAVRADGGDFTSPDWNVDYEPVGSLAGVMRLNQRELDFAATDVPLSVEELARHRWVQFPVVMGGIVVVANIGSAGARLRLSGPVLADIYMGKIRNWSDPAIKAFNPEAALPDAAIEVLHRQDGSGSTFTFTRFLSHASAEWRTRFGAEAQIAWPLGRGERGTSRLASLAARVPNSIAYLEYGQARGAGLPMVALENQSGAFVRPEPGTFQAGLAGVEWDAARGSLADTTNLPGAAAYPMAAVTYVVVPTDRGTARTSRVLDLFRLAFREGGRDALALGYIPIPPELAGRIEAHWAGSFASVNNPARPSR
ncbi:MAG: pstS [Rubritepida sp.]|nr:pstS [Rubritepida sp.]